MQFILSFTSLLNASIGVSSFSIVPPIQPIPISNILLSELEDHL